MRASTLVAATAAVAIGGAAIAPPSASAMPLVSSSILAQQGADNANVQQVWHDGRRGRRFDWGAAAVGGLLGFGLGTLLTAPRTYAYQPYGYYPGTYDYYPRTYAYGPGTYAYGTRTYAYGGGWDAHVQWCLQRYRSYDVASDSFLSYDGNRYRCNSPYVAR
jgi:hypothetical protein